MSDLGVSGKVLVAVRPEDVEIFKEYADGGLTLEGEVEDVAFLGPLVKVIVKTRSGRLKVVLPSRLADGNVSGKVYVSIRREKLMIFPADKHEEVSPPFSAISLHLRNVLRATSYNASLQLRGL